MGIAKIEGGRVVQVDRTTDVAPDGWIVIGADVTCGMIFHADGSFTAPAPDAREAVLAQIRALETSVTPRRAREAMLTDAGKTWLAAVDAQIVTLRGQL